MQGPPEHNRGRSGAILSAALRSRVGHCHLAVVAYMYCWDRVPVYERRLPCGSLIKPEG
jgi:hypothetical protein